MTLLLNAASFFMMINPPQFFSQNAIDLILNAGPIAKFVLGILTLFSIISWAIILEKLRIFSRVRRQADRFLEVVDRNPPPREIMKASKDYPDSPFAAVFKAAYWVFSRSEAASRSAGGRPPAPQDFRPPDHSPDDLARLFDSVASREMLILEKKLTFLATTGSVSPFFGLFGTVWGVMSAFLSIGMTGSADLSIVAPGIAEALITTLAGLAAAIPAVMAYNHFVNKLKRLSAELEIFYANLIEAFGRGS